MRSRLAGSGRVPIDSSVPHDYPAFTASELGDVEGLPPGIFYPPKVVFFRQGGRTDEVFYLEHGLVKLMRLQPSGDESIVGLRSAGWFLASAACVLGREYVVTAVAVTGCRVARLRANAFRQLLKSNPALSWRVHRMHSEEIYDQLGRGADLRSLPARERLERLLATIGPQLETSADGTDRKLKIPLKQWEIAQLISVTPQYVCKLLRAMGHDGVDLAE